MTLRRKRTLKRRRLRKSNFRKNVYILIKRSATLFVVWTAKLFIKVLNRRKKKIFFFKKYNNLVLQTNKLTFGRFFNLVNFKTPTDLLSIVLKQSTPNTRCTLFVANLIKATLSVGFVTKLFTKFNSSKAIRRSEKGTKVFLSFLKNFFKKNFFLFFGKKKKNQVILFNLKGINYNLVLNKKIFLSFVRTNPLGISDTYILFNINKTFTKTKTKRVRSLKKRFRKNFLCFFLKSDGL